MPWYRIDDQFHSHPKTRRAGLEAIGLWSVAGSYSMGYKTDGFAPEWIVTSWRNGRRLAESLVAAGLWEPAEKNGEQGWQFHDWSDFQDSAEEIEDARERARVRQQARRQRQRDARDKSPASTGGVTSNVTPSVTRDIPRDVQRESQPPHHTTPHHTVSPTEKREEEPHTLVADATRPRVDLAARRARFDEFWSVMPKRSKHSNPKEAARQKWNDLVRTVDPDVILAAARRLAKQREGEDPQMTPQAITWLRQKRWFDDEPEADAPTRPLGMFTPPAHPDDMPAHLFRAWNRAHHEAHLAGRPGPSDWRELREVS